MPGATSPMIFGVRPETKFFGLPQAETRVGLTPIQVQALVRLGHQVLVPTGAGARCGFPDTAFIGAGAGILPTNEAVFERADVLVGVKEPQPWEIELLRPGQIYCSYLHLGGAPELKDALKARGVTAIAYELIREDDGSLPALRPMSEVAGTMAIYQGAYLLGTGQGGKGKSVTPLFGQDPASILIFGAGVSGQAAFHAAVRQGAKVTVVDINEGKLRALLGSTTASGVGFIVNRPGEPAAQESLQRAVAGADLIIGAVLIPGRHAPIVLPADLVAMIGAGSVIIDIATDEGGCVDTTGKTETGIPFVWKLPVRDGSANYYARPNMPSDWGHTASLALADSFWPYLGAIARDGLEAALDASAALRRGTVLLYGADVPA